MPQTEPISACQFPNCGKPLGHDSKESGYVVCKEHRTCHACGSELLGPETVWCFDDCEQRGKPINEVEIVHPRCAVLKRPTIDQDPTLTILKSEYDFLNLIRLMVDPNMDLSAVTNENNARIQSNRLVSTMDLDHKLLHLKMLESCVANLSIAVRQDPKYRKDALEIREKAREKTAKREAATSHRPSAHEVTDKDVEITQFMLRTGIKERKTALAKMRDFEKAVAGMITAGIPEAMARESLLAQFTKNTKG